MPQNMVNAKKKKKREVARNNKRAAKRANKAMECPKFRPRNPKKTGTVCCKKRCCVLQHIEDDTEIFTQHVRTYLAGLPEEDERHFLLDRYSSSENSRAYFFMEKAEELQASLVAGAAKHGGGLAGLRNAVVSGWRLPRPPRDPERLVNVCQDYILHHLDMGRSDDWFRQFAFVDKSEGVGRQRVATHLTANKHTHTRTVSDPVKKTSSLSWLKGEKERNMVLPNEDKTVMPYLTRMHAHAEHVIALEKSNGCPWWNTSAVEFVDRIMTAVYEARNNNAEEFNGVPELNQLEDPEVDEAPWGDDDGKQHMGDEGKHDTDACGSEESGVARVLPHEASAEQLVCMREKFARKARESTLWRYGNQLLGPKGALPECPVIAGLGYFLQVWQGDSEAKKCIVRRWLPFAKCDTCVSNRESASTTRDIDTRRKLAEALSGHLQFVQRERMSYYMRRLQGIYLPKEFLSMIVDGADQSDHDLPHQPNKSHAADQAWRLKMHLMGVLVHGVRAYAYTCPAHIAQGNNVTIQVTNEPAHA